MTHTVSNTQFMISLKQGKQVNDMLALSRKKGEALMINNDIEITVLEIKGEQVKLGISAPKQVSIYRKEVYQQIQEANKEAANNTAAVEQLANLFQ